MKVLLIFSLICFSLFVVSNQQRQYSKYCDNGLFACTFDKLEMPEVITTIFHGFQKLFHEYSQIDLFHSNMSQLVGATGVGGEQLHQSWFCDKCMDFYTTINRKAQEEQLLKEGLDKLLIFACQFVLPKVECEGVGPRYLPVFLYSFIEKMTNAKYHCNKYHLCNDGLTTLSLEDYQKDVLSDKPTTKQIDPTGKKGNYTIVHISDIHVDLDYQTGSNSKCGLYQCCDTVNGIPVDPEDGSAFWGTPLNCDVPEIMIERTIQYIAENIKPDILLWGGDSCAHNFWSQEQATQTLQMKIITNLIKKYFANTTTSIFPMFGNHEAFPIDEYDLYTNKSDYILINGSEWWADWLGPEATQSFRENSYYSIYKPEFNLKVIVINTQVADPNNLYLIQNPTDPLNQLKWLRSQLFDAENQSQDVIILGHIPMISDVPSQWSRRYMALIDRYTNIIKGQFFGHTHNDQSSIIRSSVNQEPIGALFILPSLTTMTDRLPALRVYDVDKDTNTIINYRQYFLDLDKQNKNTDPNAPLDFEFEYDFCTEYDIDGYMSWQNLGKWADSLETNSTILQKYIKNFQTGSLTFPLAEVENNKDLRTGYICNAQNPVFDDIVACYHKFGVRDTTNIVYTLLEDFLGEWYTFQV